MRVYAGMDPRLPLAEAGAYARRMELLGFDGLHVAETVHDSFVVSALALEHTTTLTIRTAVTVAFARSPMVVAYAAWGLAAAAKGRFELGLGTQVRGNIEGRFSVPWTDAAGRMRDYVGALRAIFDSFRTGEPLRYESENYQFSRLQPSFNPGPHEHPEIRVFLGGVNERMCRLAGEVSDGFITHPTNSHPRFLAEVCIPNLRAAGRDVALIVSAPVAAGATPAATAEALEHQRRTLAFVYSTPAYRRTLELLGFGEAGVRLHELSRAGRWEEMPALVTDEMLDALVPQATYAELPALLAAWFGDLVSGIVLHPPADPADDPAFAQALADIRLPATIARGACP